MTEQEYLKTLDDLGYVVWQKWAREGSIALRERWTVLPSEIKQSYVEMGQAAAIYALTPLNKKRQELIHKKNHEGGLNPYEEAIFKTLQDIYFACLDSIQPHSPTPEFSDHIKSLLKEMESE